MSYTLNAPLILASRSVHRAQILSNAGLDFRQIASPLDERAIEAPLEEADVLPEDRAEILAEAKAVSVSEAQGGALVVGCDQILSFEGEVLHKVQDMEAARRRLLHLQGKTHMLHSAVVLCQNGQTLFRHVTPCTMTMRPMTPEAIGRHLSHAGKGVLSSVGAYQIESLGVHLFDTIDGDLFSIVGLPLLPLLSALREHGGLDG
ncbi:MAG: Maf family protein [Pseudomonadota bacterium]